MAAVEEVNEAQKQVLGAKVKQRFGADLKGKHFALWGLSFKPDTDDMRAASSRVLIEELLSAGATITAFDPVAIEEAKRVLALDFATRPELLEQIHFVENQEAALPNADALIIVTEWKIFRQASLSSIHAGLKAPIVFDGRNLYDPALVKQAGIEYHAIGRAVLTKN